MPDVDALRAPSGVQGKLGLALGRLLQPAAAPHRMRGPVEARAVLELADAWGVPLLDLGAAAPPRSEALLAAAPAGARVVVRAAPPPGGGPFPASRLLDALPRVPGPRRRLFATAPSDLLAADGEALWRRALDLKEAGELDAVGIMAGGTDGPRALARRFRPDFMQLPASLLEPELIVDGTLEDLAGAGVEVQIRSVFRKGLLFLPRSELPSGLADCGPRLSRLQRALLEAGADLLQAALAFVMQRPEASSVIVGISSASELKAVLRAADAPSPRLDWDALAGAAPTAGAARSAAAAA